MVIRYGFAAPLTTIPIYLVIAIFGETFSLIPNEAHELHLGGIIIGLLTAWYIFTGIQKALAGRSS